MNLLKQDDEQLVINNSYFKLKSNSIIFQGKNSKYTYLIYQEFRLNLGKKRY